jgi:predicted dehydrogenase
MNVGHIGLGQWGKNFPRIYSEFKRKNKIKEVFIFDIDKDKTKKLAKKYSLSQVSNLEELIQKADAISIATPSYTHYELAKKCLLAGKDVFVEKPITLNSKDGEELANLTEKNKLIFMSGHILCYNPVIQKLKDIKGNLGEIFFIYSLRINKMMPRIDCGVVFDYATHDFALFEYLLGIEDGLIFNSYVDNFASPFEDVSFFVLTYGRVKCMSFVSWLSHVKKREIYAVGRKATALADYHYNTQTLTIFSETEKKSIHVQKKEPLYNELEHFIFSVEKRRKPITDVWCGVRAIKTAEKILNFS